jgi:polyphosphate kinase
MSFANAAENLELTTDRFSSLRLSGHSPAGTAAPDCTSFCADASEPDVTLIERALAPERASDLLLFNDRELSFLRFQARVFEEAQDDTIPLLDRVKFLAIVGTHLDDFVRVRAPELRRNVARRMLVESILKRLVYTLEVYWRRRLLPALRAAGIHIVTYRRLTAEERTEVDAHFADVVYPALAPLALDLTGRFPQVASLGMNLLVETMASGGERRFLLRIPDALPPLVPFHTRRLASSALTRNPELGTRTVEEDITIRGYVWLDQVVVANLRAVFPEAEVISAHRFRLLREVDVSPQTSADTGALERALTVLRVRERNPVAALVADRRMRDEVLADLARRLGVADGAVHRSSAVADLRRLWEITRIARPELKAPPFQPREPLAVEGHTDVLAAARERDILLHHPYESFQPVVEMIRQAARDPDVVRISLTLYRTDRESPVVHALLDAVRQGKQVRVLVELNARLDEHRNVNWWRIFEQAGASVFPSPAGLKVHAKMALIERHEANRLRRYAHLSSGNYNAFTARAYTDVALLTCDEDITADVASLFDALSTGTVPSRFRALTVAPINMRDVLTALIDREIACHRRGERGHIILKMNGLVDRDVIRLLYRASQEGVYVDLLVRSLCCLRPGIPGVSDRIRVRSIVGRFLEHSRVWYRRNGGDEEVYIGSADLMPRNLDRRVEVMAPLKDTGLRRRLFEILRLYLADNVKARELRADGSYVHPPVRAGERLLDAQLALMREVSPRHLVLVHDTPRGNQQAMVAE